jgi:hypothetical protein
MSDCSCQAWIQELPVPEKVIILKCSVCGTSYTLYPNGEIEYETYISSNIGLVPSGEKP